MSWRGFLPVEITAAHNVTSAATATAMVEIVLTNGRRLRGLDGPSPIGSDGCAGPTGRRRPGPTAARVRRAVADRVRRAVADRVRRLRGSDRLSPTGSDGLSPTGLAQLIRVPESA
jgi:hypothetical protein